jgi:hypothetical protein
VLAVLLSIKEGKPIGYDSRSSVYQVIEAGLRSGFSDVGKHAFAIIYLLAYKIYKPSVNDKNKRWIQEYAYKVKDSVKSGDQTYRRYGDFDTVIALLFPELGDELISEFALQALFDPLKVNDIDG